MPSFQQFDTTMQLLQKVLDLRTKNQQVISSNIANSETPGYTSKSLAFEEELKNAIYDNSLKTTTSHPNHFPLSSNNLNQISGTITRTKNLSTVGDGNNVSVDMEMVKLSENQIMYEAAATILNKKLALLKFVANDGK